jgi:N6-adenosine-specific RNA methylase IME4
LYRPDLPDGQFGTIYADPPWTLTTPGVRRKLHYDRMTTEDICAIPVGDIATDDAHLWLWSTNAHLPEALSVMAAWGFKYRTVLTWKKNRMGTGWWLRGKTEQLLFGAKSTKQRSNPGNVTTILEAPVHGHSEKPEEARAIIERLSPGPYLEMFAREQHPGWTSLISHRAAPQPYGDKPSSDGG